MHRAALDGNLEALEYMSKLSYWPEIVNDQSAAQKFSPLLFAVSRRDFKTVKFLHRNGASLTTLTDEGMSPFHMAASVNDLYSMAYMLENQPKNFEIDIQSTDGWTPAHLSGMMGNLDMTNYLIEKKADLFKKSAQGMSVVDEIIRSDHADLLGCIYDILPQKNKSSEALKFIHLASGTGSIACIHYLIQKGENPNLLSSDENKAAPLHFAVLSSNPVAVKTLISGGALINIQDGHGNTPYNLASQLGNQEILRIIEDFGGNALIQNEQHLNAVDVAFNDGVK